MSPTSRVATSPFAPMWRSVRTRGISSSCALAARWGFWRLHPRAFHQTERAFLHAGEWLFDRIHGVDTRSDLTREIDDAAEATRVHGIWYEATGTRTFARAMSLVPDDAHASTFVDLGCGKGRVLLQAADRLFPRMVGVEHSPTLVRIAEANAAAFRGGRHRDAIRIEHGDAAEFEFPDDDLVVYMFNPFDAVLMQRVVDRLVDSLNASPRQAVVVYFNPVHAALFMETGRFVEIGRHASVLRPEVRAYRWR